jgi:hypothetical protein
MNESALYPHADLSSMGMKDMESFGEVRADAVRQPERQHYCAAF